MKFILFLALCCICAHSVISADEAKEESKIWAALKDGVAQIYALKPKLTISQHMEMSSKVYEYCTNVPKFNQGNIINRSQSIGAELIGEELYQKLKDFLDKFLDDIFAEGMTLKDEQLLQFYSAKWDEFRLSSRTLNHVFGYLNRHWVYRQRGEGHKDIHQVYDLALITWREKLFRHINKPLTASILSLIERERNGEIINSNIIQKAINNYVELGIDSDAPGARGTNLLVYKEFFESDFINATRKYLLAEREEFLRLNSFTEYMKRVEQRINEEASRVEAYLHKNTLSTLMKTCDQVLIESCLETFHEEFQNLLDDDKYEDLARLYSLTERIPDGLAKLNDVFEDYVVKQGRQAIDEVAEAAKNDPKLYVQTILKVYRNNLEIVQNRFTNNRGFMDALGRAMKRFVNDNAVTKTSTTINKSPELLAKYCDSLLKKSSKSENLQNAELEAALSDAMTVFKYIEERDVFQQFYTKMLANRLINRMSVSEDAELFMLVQLKELCGFEYTNKLEHMFTDIKLSNAITQQFHEEVKLSSDVDVNAQVLRSSFWPLGPVQFPFKVPEELVESQDKFTEFYNGEHQGRHLMWVYQKCKGEITTNFLQRKYTFQVSLFQMAVLLQYNEVDSMTVDELVQATGIIEEVMLQVLHTLVKADLLKSDDASSLNKNSVIELNQGYKNKKLRVNLNVPLKKDPNSRRNVDDEEAEKYIREGRKYEIEAAIVRIMKARERLSHKELVEEVIKALEHRFKPELPMIQREIEGLIDKEHIEEADDEKDTYIYIP